MSQDIDKVQQFVAETLQTRFDIGPDDLTPGSTLRDLKIDSLGGVELSLVLKKQYGVQFVAGEISVDFTTADIAELVRQKLPEPQDAVS
ncbi:acyl carrier protein [Actinoplanes sp. N902-109]|uniref:acyl carrier protein n=1 Tax=Actinoplanes sp. (strain N902-109) TaxID=649831 RepID=UPI0003294687|nr:acyl carrier protein [Actinoplanes sp. N902-109]AGL13743.1 non-ribosomal peptide synthase [Actinoplanes sp. N902-109]